jgi:hypothetical protein
MLLKKCSQLCVKLNDCLKWMLNRLQKKKEKTIFNIYLFKSLEIEIFILKEK